MKSAERKRTQNSQSFLLPDILHECLLLCPVQIAVIACSIIQADVAISRNQQATTHFIHMKITSWIIAMTSTNQLATGNCIHIKINIMDCVKGLTKTTHNYPVNKHENNTTGQDNDLTKNNRQLAGSFT